MIKGVSNNPKDWFFRILGEDDWDEDYAMAFLMPPSPEDFDQQVSLYIPEIMDHPKAEEPMENHFGLTDENEETLREYLIGLGLTEKPDLEIY